MLPPQLKSVDNKTVIYSNGEQVTFKITTLDQFGNFRQGVFVAEGPIVNEVYFELTNQKVEYEHLYWFCFVQPIGAVSANETPHIYSIPSKDELSNATSAKTNVNVRFQVRSSSSLVINLCFHRPSVHSCVHCRLSLLISTSLWVTAILATCCRNPSKPVSVAATSDELCVVTSEIDTFMFG